MKRRPVLDVLPLALLALLPVLLPQCSQSTPTENGMDLPSISNLAAQPATLAVGETASVTAQVRDPDADVVTWTLAVESTSSGQGTLSPATGTGDISATFTATRAGTVLIRAAATHRGAGVATETVTLTVREGGPTTPGH